MPVPRKNGRKFSVRSSESESWDACCGETEGSGSMGKSVHTQRRRLVRNKLIRLAAGHFWEAELSLRQGRMGVNSEVIDGFSWFMTRSPSPPASARLCHELPLRSTSFTTKADRLRWVSNNLTHTPVLLQLPDTLCSELFTVNTQDMMETTGEDIILDSTAAAAEWENQTMQVF